MFKKVLKEIGFAIFCLIVLALAIRGLAGNPDERVLVQEKWQTLGPFELSPERGRFALTYSLVENKSFYFTNALARFATPDLGYKDGKFVSLFAPGVSFLVAPGYILGKVLGISQVGTYFVVSLFAVANALLVKNISETFSGSRVAGTISALVFLFATPSFAYSVGLYQHHISTTFILLCIYLILRKNSNLALAFVWFLIGLSFSVDYPNIFLMLPVAIFSLKRVFKQLRDEGTLSIQLDLRKLFTIVFVLPPIVFLLWFNKVSYGDPLILSGTVKNIRDINFKLFDNVKDNVELSSDTIFSGINFFQTRNLINGISVHLFSQDRGVIFFTPVILLGIVGILESSFRNKKIYSLLTSIIGINILIYSMWGDPWGGWAFGSRYLMPSYAVLAIFLGIAIAKLKKDKVFMSILILASFYSIAVNTVGALTTSANPPKIEAENLSLESGKIEKYTFERNFDFLLEKGSKSFVYQEIFKKFLSPLQFYFLILGLILSPTFSLILYIYFYSEKKTLELLLETKGSWKEFRFLERIKGRLLLRKNF